MVDDRVGLPGENVVDGGDVVAETNRQVTARQPLSHTHAGGGPGPQRVRRGGGVE
jgi:hypothetical protein